MPRPAQSILERLVEEIGSDLPAEYVKFVERYDGATPEPNSLMLANNEVGVSRFIPATEASRLANEIDGFPRNVIILAEDDCGNYFYIEPRTGSVYFWDHEIEGADELVASGAMQFAESLIPFDASTVKLAPGQVKRVWIDPSFKPEF